ncbi:hypothetical protein HHK36_002536 [Tetracentron sinense]|uniref:Protein kinase domain-containing protein n=1 Tax=Tetracentron sinense TaxID=13715 RepID=A0A834ZVQ9_TETSI|nr:hypothetical protein HHK36_002536 [Tetracentron sinense]
MGGCSSKPSPKPNPYARREEERVKENHIPSESPNHQQQKEEAEVGKRSPFFPFYSPSPAHYLFSKKSPANPSSKSTPKRLFKRPFPPPSPAKHIRALLVRRHGSLKPNEAAIPEGHETEAISGLDKRFGFSKHFGNKYELGDEVGRGHFGYTCAAKFKKGELKGQQVAVKVIPKSKVLCLSLSLSLMYSVMLQILILVDACSVMKTQFSSIFRLCSSFLPANGNLIYFPCQMTTAIAIEDVRREVKILRALTGHKNLVHFYDAYEDHDNVYIVMELCEGGELLDRILSRGGKYSEDDAKDIMVQILNIVAFCHLQGVVHRDLKPEVEHSPIFAFLIRALDACCKVIFNFLFTFKDANSQMKAIDFGLSDFVKPDERLNDIVGSAYYVAPEVLHRSYSIEADVWSVGVIAYILLCGSRPFWARTESGIFRAVLKADPSFDEPPWPSLSSEAKDFVKCLLNKDPRKRMTAAQALSHPWIRNHNDVQVPLDILIFRLMKVYMRSSSLRKAALRALSKTLTVDELFYLKEQFALLEPSKNDSITLENIRTALMKNATDAMKDSRVLDFLASLDALQYRRMDFEEFCAAALNIHQLEALDRWEQHARRAFEIFEKDGNRAIVIEELASVCWFFSFTILKILYVVLLHTEVSTIFSTKQTETLTNIN